MRLGKRGQYVEVFNLKSESDGPKVGKTGVCSYFIRSDGKFQLKRSA